MNAPQQQPVGFDAIINLHNYLSHIPNPSSEMTAAIAKLEAHIIIFINSLKTDIAK